MNRGPAIFAATIARQLNVLRHAFGRGWLNQPIARTRDAEIDRALADLGQTRADLFTPQAAWAAHRVRIARMLAARGVDVPRAVEEHWEELKKADNYCYYCPDPKRCQSWLERPWHDMAPKVFCRNDALISALAAERGAGEVPRWSGEPH